MTTQAGHFCICIFFFVRFLCIMRLREFIFYVATELFDRHKAAVMMMMRCCHPTGRGCERVCWFKCIVWYVWDPLALYTCHTSNVERACVYLWKEVKMLFTSGAALLYCVNIAVGCSTVSRFICSSNRCSSALSNLSALLMPRITISDFHLGKFPEKVISQLHIFQKLLQFCS
jgi:hypothetical protein